MIFLTAATLLFILALLSTLFSYYKKRADYADIVWGFGFMLLSWSSYFLGPRSPIGGLLSILVTLWALRLSLHIYLRNRGKEEDRRYQELFHQSKYPYFLFLFFKVYLLQALFLYIISLPLLWTNSFTTPLNLKLLYPALTLWCIGWVMESVSDYSLYRFKNRVENRGKLYTQGLWKYSRHPNYLGEIIQWWAIWWISLEVPFSIYFIISPLTITCLILFVSGIPMLEKKIKTHPDFPLYSKTASLLIPSSWTNGLISFLILWGYITSFHEMREVFWLALILNLLIFKYQDRKSLLLALPILIVTTLLGTLQELSFAYFHLPSPLPLIFYPLLALMLNSSLQILSRSLYLPFLVGASGAIPFYYESYPFVALLWGLFLTLLILYNRSLVKLYEHFTAPESLANVLTVFFDGSCPVCSREMKWLQKREQKGTIIYVTAKNHEELKEWTDRFTFEESMKTIHALDQKEHLYKGIDTLAEVYARVSIPSLAILMKAPGFYWIFQGLYFIWAKLRPRRKGSCKL